MAFLTAAAFLFFPFPLRPFLSPGLPYHHSRAAADYITAGAFPMTPWPFYMCCKLPCPCGLPCPQPQPSFPPWPTLQLQPVLLQYLSSHYRLHCPTAFLASAAFLSTMAFLAAAEFQCRCSLSSRCGVTWCWNLSWHCNLPCPQCPLSRADNCDTSLKPSFWVQARENYINIRTKGKASCSPGCRGAKGTRWYVGGSCPHCNLGLLKDESCRIKIATSKLQFNLQAFAFTTFACSFITCA